jgi:Flp pilus assembly protein TadD
MWFGRRLHAVVGAAAWIVAVVCVVAAPARGQPTDIPAFSPPPPRFAVAPFENRSGAKVFDWLVAGAPFEISEKTEAVLGLEPAGGALHVGGAAVAPAPGPIAAFANAHQAVYVITGWVERPSWQLRVGLSLWNAAGATAVVAAEVQRTGDVRAYHQLLGDALGELWTQGAGLAVDAARRDLLARPLSTDHYAVTLLGRGLGHLTGALGAVDLKAAEHDLERAAFIDPKCFEAQRVLGELYLRVAPGEPRAVARAVGKFNYANDLAPDNIAALRAAARGAVQAGKHEAALALFRRLVIRRPWDLDARYELGAALWQTGAPAAAEKQLEQVTAQRADHLAARRVLVLIHAARSDTAKLVAELEAIANRAPDDLDVKADLATAYGALARWDKATAALELVAAARPSDLALHIRIGDAHRKLGDLAAALAWYGRASQLAPDSSWPGFAAAQLLFDVGRLTEAARGYAALKRFRDDLPAAEQALGVIALAQGRPVDAVGYLRRAVGGAPRDVLGWRALVSSELARGNPAAALADVRAALPTWPDDGHLRYLAGVASAQLGELATARRELVAATAAATQPVAQRAAAAALGALDAGGALRAQLAPELARPWGDADALTDALARYAATARALGEARERYQRDVLGLLGALHLGPNAPGGREPVRRCPIARIAPRWATAQAELAAISRLGVELERSWRFLARHDEVGATAGLLPNARTQVAAARKGFRIALADLGELRAMWARSLAPELRAAGCTERLLAAAAADPARYRLADDERPEVIPTTQPPRPRGRATFYVDNSRCLDPVEVWVDGSQLGQVAPGRRSALVADAGDRALCLLVPGAAQCGDRGTLRQVYLHDGWSVTMHCPK